MNLRLRVNTSKTFSRITDDEQQVNILTDNRTWVKQHYIAITTWRNIASVWAHCLKELWSFTTVQERECEGKTKWQLIKVNKRMKIKVNTLIEDEDKIELLNKIIGKSKVTSKSFGGCDWHLSHLVDVQQLLTIRCNIYSWKYTT